MNRVRTAVGLTFFVLVAIAAVVSPAFAHSDIVERSPAPDSVLARNATVVTAVFSEELGSNSALEILDLSRGTVVATGGLDLADLEHLSLLAEVDLGPGAYRAEWTAESAEDGDMTEGSWSFSVAGPGGVVPAVPDEGSGLPTLALALGLLLIACAIVGATVRRKRTPQPSETPELVKSSLLVVLALVFVFGAAAPASAHGRIVSSDPPEGASVTDAPDELRIWISETVSPRFSSVELTTLDGTVIPIDGLEVSVDGDLGLLIVDLPDLGDGTYSATWTVLSDSDGHITRGLVVFGVGAGDVDTASISRPTEPIPAAETVVRWLALAALMLLVGFAAIGRFVLPAHREAEWRGGLLRWMRLWAVLGTIAGVSALAVQSADVLAGLPDGSRLLDVAVRLATTTLWGRLWMVREAAFISATALAVVGLRRMGRFPHVGFLALGAALIAAQALSSHGAGVAGETALGVTVDAVHLASASIWVGGLVALVLLGRRLPAVPWRRFGNVAAVAVALLAATGLFSAGLQVASIDAVLQTAYGRVLMTKLGIVALVGVVGLTNAMLVRPTLAAPLARLLRRPRGWTPLRRSQLRRLVVVEAALGVVVIGATALLTSLSPANGVEFAPATAGVDSRSEVIGDMAITLLAQPNLPGDNVFVVHAASAKRPASEPIDRVLLRFAFGEQDFGRTTVQMEEIEPGRFRLGGNQFLRPGEWAVDVVVRRRGLPDAVASFDWIVPGGRQEPPIVSDAPLGPKLGQLSVAILVALLLGIAWTQWGVRLSRPARQAGESGEIHQTTEPDTQPEERQLEGVHS